MFKRAVRRALDARKANRQPEQAVPPAVQPPAQPAHAQPAHAQPAHAQPAHAQPAPAPPTAAPRSASGMSIAARIAAGDTAEARPAVSATSGASHTQDMGLSTTQDGAVYWGTTDNESARARGTGQTLVIDQWECIACGTCVENTDAVFVLPDDAKAVVLAQEGDMALIQDAIDACPVTCIHWRKDPADFEQLNDAVGHPV
jgi:ferredoxin